MTYETDVENSRFHNVGFYVRFEGIPTRFSSHNPDDYDNWNPSETFDASLLLESLSGGAQRLDKAKGLVLPSGFGFSIAKSATALTTFVRKGGTEDTLSSTLTATSTSIATTNGTLADGATVYLGRETVTLGGKSGTNYLTCTRAEEDTFGDAHRQGAVLSTVPRHWKGRRCTLYAVNLKTGTEKALRTGILSNSARFDNNVYRFSCYDLMTVLNRKLLTGWQEQPTIGTPTASTFTRNGYELASWQFTVSDGRELQDDGFVLFNVDGRSVVVPLYATQSSLVSAGTFDVVWTKLAGDGPEDFGEVLEAQEITVRQVEYFSGRLSDVALSAILSVYGDGNNSATYDVLAGRPVSTENKTDQVRKRSGAGIPAAWVDTASWNLLPGERIRFVLDEETTLQEFLTNEILWRSGGFAYVTGDGKLSFQKYTPVTVRGSLPTLTKSEVLLSNVTTQDDEDQNVAQFEWDCNYVPGDRQYTKKLVLPFDDELDLFDGETENVVSLQSRSLWSGPAIAGNQASDPIGPLELQSVLQRFRARTGQSGVRVKLLLPWTYHVDFVEGYRFSYTDDRVPDHEGNLGVTSLALEVVGTQPDYVGGTWVVECEAIPTGVRVAPSAVIDSYGSLIATLKSAGVHGDGTLFDDNPGRDWAADFAVRVYDATDDFQTSDVVQVASVGDNSLTFTADPVLNGGDPPNDGDLVVLEDVSGDTGNTNAAGADVQDYAFGADSNDQVGTGGALRDGDPWQ